MVTRTLAAKSFVADNIVDDRLDVAAGRLMRDIHLLASAYGWTEAEVLSLSAWRRQAYLDMVTL